MRWQSHRPRSKAEPEIAAITDRPERRYDERDAHERTRGLERVRDDAIIAIGRQRSPRSRQHVDDNAGATACASSAIERAGRPVIRSTSSVTKSPHPAA